MNEIIDVLKNTLNIDLIRMILSNPSKANPDNKIIKMKVRPILLKGELRFQCESFTMTQAFQKNFSEQEALEYIQEAMSTFRQLQIETITYNYAVLISKKGKVTVKKSKNKNEVKQVITTHNRKKTYILEEGIYVPFLEELGVMTRDGKIIKSKYDKYRQINRYLEFVEDSLPKLAKDREIKIVDFGCGKSYLSFAMYYYLHQLKQYDVRIIGLDLKEDVIQKCNRLAKEYGYEKLSFEVGNIGDYESQGNLDMVVTLHACDTATDMALAKAVKWETGIILAVPCCQHELNGQINCEELNGILKYGLIKERIASLVTDGLRAQYLEEMGYEVQVLEFIDMEHTPKNILIRAYKGKKNHRSRLEIEKINTLLNTDPLLGHLLK